MPVAVPQMQGYQRASQATPTLMTIGVKEVDISVQLGHSERSKGKSARGWGINPDDIAKTKCTVTLEEHVDRFVDSAILAGGRSL